MRSGSGGVGTSSEASCATRRSTRSGSGRSCTRYRHGTLLARKQRRDRLVGGDHQVLDQPVGLGLRARADLGDVAVLVEDELRLLGVDGQRPAPLARALQRRGRRARGRQRRRPRLARRPPRPAKMRSTRS